MAINRQGGQSCWRRPDAFRLYDRPSPVFIGTGRDPDILPKRSGAEGQSLGLQMVEQRHIGMTLDDGRSSSLGCGDCARTGGNEGVFSRSALNRQPDRDFANIPIRTVENLELKIFILNGARSIEFEQIGQRQVFDQNRPDKKRTGPRVKRKTASYIRSRNLDAVAGRIDG